MVHCLNWKQPKWEYQHFKLNLFWFWILAAAQAKDTELLVEKSIWNCKRLFLNLYMSTLESIYIVKMACKQKKKNACIFNRNYIERKRSPAIRLAWTCLNWTPCSRPFFFTPDKLLAMCQQTLSIHHIDFYFTAVGIFTTTKPPCCENAFSDWMI